MIKNKNGIRKRYKSTFNRVQAKRIQFLFYLHLFLLGFPLDALGFI
jgi:hypothetical protein